MTEDIDPESRLAEQEEADTNIRLFIPRTRRRHRKTSPLDRQKHRRSDEPSPGDDDPAGPAAA